MLLIDERTLKSVTNDQVKVSNMCTSVSECAHACMPQCSKLFHSSSANQFWYIFWHSGPFLGPQFGMRVGVIPVRFRPVLAYFSVKTGYSVWEKCKPEPVEI